MIVFNEFWRITRIEETRGRSLVIEDIKCGPVATEQIKLQIPNSSSAVHDLLRKYLVNFDRDKAI